MGELDLCHPPSLRGCESSRSNPEIDIHRFLNEMGVTVWKLNPPTPPKTLDCEVLNLETNWLVWTESPIEHEHLLSAILKAAKAKPASASIRALWSPFTPEQEINPTFKPSLILIMGEYPAGVLLHTLEPLEELRGRAHTLGANRLLAQPIDFAQVQGARVFRSAVYSEVNEHSKNECNAEIGQKIRLCKKSNACPVIVTYSLPEISSSKECKRKAWQDIQLGMRLCHS